MDKIRVWRCQENQELVRVLENLQQLALGFKDTEIDEKETTTEAEYGKARPVQITTQKGKTDAN
jgi:hypothetical protein